MGKINVVKRDNFTIINNHVLQNKNLSLKAKGLYAFMWSLPPDWDYSVNGLVAVLKEGRDAINVALKELENEGYLVRSISRSGGKFSDMDYCLNEIPDPFRDSTEIQKNPEKKKDPVKVKQKPKKTYADIFNSEENKYISEALQKYIHDCSGKGIRFQTATVEGFAQFLREEAGKDPVLAMRIVDQSLDKGWKRLYKLKNYGGAGENIERVPYKPEDLAKDEKGELVVY